MGYHSKLYDAIKRSEAQEALFITGKLIFEEELQLLEYTWIRAIANLGEYTNVCFPKWHETCKNIVAMLETKEFHIKDAFQITSKLCILYQNSTQYVTFPKLTVVQLRAKVVDCFDDSIKLSDVGKQKFLMILPKPTNEHDFCLKIISGLIKLWNSKEYITFHDAVEYLCRKNYLLESLASETEPTIVSFLWDFMKVFQKDITEPVYKIYKTYFKKKDKLWRYGLLYGLHNFLHPHYNTISWSEHEKNLLTRVEEITEDLWKYIADTVEDTEPEDTESEYDKVSIFESYYPKAHFDITHQVEYPIEKVNTKSVYVKSKKKRGEDVGDLSKEKEITYNKGYRFPI
jgi:hypothetical protein